MRFAFFHSMWFLRFTPYFLCFSLPFVELKFLLVFVWFSYYVSPFYWFRIKKLQNLQLQNSKIKILQNSKIPKTLSPFSLTFPLKFYRIGQTKLKINKCLNFSFQIIEGLYNALMPLSSSWPKCQYYQLFQFCLLLKPHKLGY